MLTEEGGALLADYEVDLIGVDAGKRDAGWESFADLESHLRWRAAVDRRLEHEAVLLAEVGDWITDRALGPAIAGALAAWPGPVRLVVPEVAQWLAYLPWQAARVRGRALAAQKVTFVTDPFGRPPVVKAPVGDRLRMLAVFSLPEGTGALNLRRERISLARLVERIGTTNNRAVELRVLQYGATRARLEDALLEAEGWDILHLSGHGLPAGLVLEDDTGQHDKINTEDLVDLVDAASERLKLITLSACESAALTATDHLRLLGLSPGGGDGFADESGRDGSGGDASGQAAAVGGDDVSASGGVPGTAPRGAAADAETVAGRLSVLATALVDRLDVAVLAMRFPVVDGFAIGLAERFYDLVLGKGQPVDRALGLALPRVVPAEPTATVPALSVVTPALFGVASLGLKLEAPAGKPVVFESERVKLAAFPAQPERFVGRVGPMTRAATALAPQSGTAGVLFHGMAGAGKTACALELAYTHEASFQRLVWHQAPTQDQDIASAFTRLVMSLEEQIPGIKLLHVADDVAALRGFLPVLTEFLERNRVLLVLDNLESLLTSTGTWRDDRFGLLLDAMTVPSGLSRLVLTSRVLLATPPPGLRVEAVHALSLQESVLLAREWPHLQALIDTLSTNGRDDPGSGWGLARRVLRLVQGHPKLIELADGQAQNPAALAARLDEVDRAWLTRGVRLQDFLDTGQPHATDQDYYQVLDTWTRSATTNLPDASRLLFTVLAGLEDDDRIPFVLDEVWPVLWDKPTHLDPAPPMPDTIAPLVEQALVAVETNQETGDVVAYRIHPGLAESTRAHTPTDTVTLIDTAVADFWLAVLQHGREHEAEGLGWLVRRAARAAAPYLTRRQDWATLDAVLNHVLTRDNSPGTAAELIPFLQAAADATTATDLEIRCGFTYARAVSRLRPTEALTVLGRLLDLAHQRGDHATASIVAGDLINRYRDAGRFEDALRLIDEMQQDDRLAGHGPWTQLVDENYRLQIRRLQGHGQEVLDAVDQLRNRMAALPETSDLPETIRPFNVRELILDSGMLAARDLGLWQRALDLNDEKIGSKQARGASDREVASSRYNDYGPLRALGRLTEARALLLWCREVFAADHDISMLSKTLTGLADIEDNLGHGQAAIDLERDALRLSYSANEVVDTSVSHANLANYLDRYTERPVEALAHQLAAGVIEYQINSGWQTRSSSTIARLMRRADMPPTPTTFDEICAIVDQVDGVHLAALVERLPRRVPDGQTALSEVLALAAAIPADEAVGLAAHQRAWEPIISALVATLSDNPSADADTVRPGLGDGGFRAAASAFFAAALDHFAGATDWVALAEALKRVQEGERDPAALTTNLDQIDTAILHRTLVALDGTEPIDPTLWTTSTELNTADDDGDDGMEQFVAAIAAAANGDVEAAATIDPVLDQLAAESELAGLATALRAIVAGERDPAVLTVAPEAQGGGVIAAVLAELTAPPDGNATSEADAPDHHESA